MPRRGYSFIRRRRFSYSHRSKPRSMSRSRSRRYRGGGHFMQPLPPLQGYQEFRHFNRASGWRKPLPPILSHRGSFDKRGSVDYIFSRKGSGQFHYPSRESKYSPWEKIKYKFVKDRRPWPPVFRV